MNLFLDKLYFSIKKLNPGKTIIMLVIWALDSGIFINVLFVAIYVNCIIYLPYGYMYIYTTKSVNYLYLYHLV